MQFFQRKMLDVVVFSTRSAVQELGNPVMDVLIGEQREAVRGVPLELSELHEQLDEVVLSSDLQL